MTPSDDMKAAAATIAGGDGEGDIQSVTPLTGGSSALVVAMDLNGPNGIRRVVFRQHRPRSIKEHGSDVAAKEFHVLAWLSESGLEVPRPLALHGDNSADGPWLVVDWIDGETAQGFQSAEIVAGVVEAMANFLARLHAKEKPGALDTIIKPIEDPVSELSRYLPADDLGVSLASLATDGIKRRPNAPVMLHGDFWPGNVMIGGQKLLAVIDWEDSAFGDPLADLATARIEIACAFGDRAAEDFTELYVKTMDQLGLPIDPFDLPLWEVYASASALASMHLWGLSAREERARRSATSEFYERAAAELLNR